MSGKVCGTVSGKISKRSGPATADTRFNRKLAAEILECRRLAKSGRDPGHVGFYPALQEVLQSATENARRRRRHREVMYFTFRGRRYSYTVTNLGRLFVRDSSGEPIASTGYGEMWGD